MFNFKIKDYNLSKQGFILGLVLILFFGAACTKSQKTDDSAVDNMISSKPMVQRLIDGLSVEKFQEDLLPVAIMMDNFWQSRPAAGLNSASIVYEAPAEAGITRFLAIFDIESLPERVGPVRSVRPYFLDLLEEYQALVAHAGGSPEALNKIDKGYYKFCNLDEISADGIYFWRDYSKQAPFNLYTSRQLVKKAIQRKGWPEIIWLNFNPWSFKELEQQKLILSQQIRIDYQEPALWRYDSESNKYLRFFSDGRLFVDEQAEQIQTTNLIIQKTQIQILDKIGRRAVDLESGGEAIIFRNGQKINGRWQKINNRTKFYDSAGQEIDFLPGNFWIEIVSDVTPIQYQSTTAG